MSNTTIPWTRFMDMRSGGGRKEKQSIILVEAPEAEAVVIFCNRFGHNPNRVTCTCCGEDYSTDESESLEQATACDRGCRYAYIHKETGEEIPESEGFIPMKGVKEGYVGKYVEGGGDRSWRPYRTLEDYLKSEDVLVIRASEIPAEKRQGDVPAQGYVWVE